MSTVLMNQLHVAPLPLGTPLGLRMKAGGGKMGPCSAGFARFLVEESEQLNTFG